MIVATTDHIMALRSLRFSDSRYDSICDAVYVPESVLGKDISSVKYRFMKLGEL